MIAYSQDVLVFARLIRDESNNIDDAPSVRPPVDNRRSPRPVCPVLRLPGVSHFDSEVMRPGLRDTLKKVIICNDRRFLVKWIN